MSTTAARSRPLLYSAPMVRAILGGLKTQTRRVMKPQPPPGRDECWVAYTHGKPLAVYRSFDTGSASTGLCECPYGQPGDRLWVRETWGLLDTEPSDGPERATIGYRADGDEQAPNGRLQLWRPSIFMPRWASRITLEITGVRVERARDISDADIEAEGVAEYAAGLGLTPGDPGRRRELWAHLWDAVNGKRDDGAYAWKNKPWTWVLEFRVLEGLEVTP